MLQKEDVLNEQPIYSVREQDDFLPLLPLKNVVVLPKSIQPIMVGRPLSIKAVEFALKHNRPLFITAQRDSKTESPTEADLFTVGTRANILQVMRLPNGALKILAEGIMRARIEQYDDGADFIGVVATEIPTTSAQATIELEASWRQLQSQYLEYAKLNEKAPTEITALVKTADDMDAITDTIGVHIGNLTFENRQEILETPDLIERMFKLSQMLQKEIEILYAEQRIRGHVQTQVDKNQKEYYLTEQMKAIQKELGHDDQSAEMSQMRTKVAGLNLPKEALERVEKELRRLDQMPPLSSEAVVSRHYVDWITSLPWHKITQDTISLANAQKILNTSHAGLKKPKERIVEFLAAKKFAKNLERSPIICLVGPPGVGKTSLGKSIAESLGREFVRISLGGIRDEAEIRGHRRTYIGALPGKIIQAMKKASTMNPVILLDEIDKMSRDIHGDPAAALLEVLDPEQNKTFVDHYLDIEYDLSKVMFIATANVMDHIPYPLYDRLEIIQLSGYTDEEKFAITKQFLIPKNLAEYELSSKQIQIPDEVLEFIIAEYTKEAGVRQLERLIAKLMRKTIQVLLQSKKNTSVTVTKDLVKEWLGNPVFKKTSLNKKAHRIGLATGLAWTEVGGDVLEIETSVLAGKGGMTLTGQLGEVMQESAQAALSYLRSRIKELGIKKDFYSTKDIHLHIPEGATPKDGPSAGITICAALVSGLTDNPIKADLAMTGEITLQGRVLSVGGLKEKLLAAKQHGIKTVVVPQENFDDIQEILKEANLGDLQLIYASTMDDVLKVAFEKDPFNKVRPQSTRAERIKKEPAKAKSEAPKKPMKKKKPVKK